MIVSKFNGRAYAACRAHLGLALDHVTYGTGKVATVNVMEVKGKRDADGRVAYICHCHKPAVFYVFEVEERPEPSKCPECGSLEPASRRPNPPGFACRNKWHDEPEAEAGAPVSDLPPCPVHLHQRHHMACTGCGQKGGDW